jgi:hypothetical protein
MCIVFLLGHMLSFYIEKILISSHSSLLVMYSGSFIILSMGEVVVRH